MAAHVPVAERAGRMFRAAEILQTDRAALARLITEEMGKPIAAAEAEIEKCAVGACEFFAAHAAALLAPHEVATDASKSYVRYDPLGVVLAIMPLELSLLAGLPLRRTGAHGGQRHGAQARLERAGQRDGHRKHLPRRRVPRRAFRRGILVPAGKALDLIARREIRAVTITGSDRAGRGVAAAAGRAIRKTVLELGGSDPCLVLSDADPVAAAQTTSRTRTVNAGQVRIAAKRFIVEAPIAEKFEEALAEAMAGELRVGDPMDHQDRGRSAGSQGPCRCPAQPGHADGPRRGPRFARAAARWTAGASVLSQPCFWRSSPGWPRSMKRRSVP